MNIIKAVNLVFDYIRRDEEGQVEEVKRALDHVNLEIEKGSFVAILGYKGRGASVGYPQKCGHGLSEPG